MKTVLMLSALFLCTSALAQDVLSEIPDYWPLARNEFNDLYPADSFSVRRTKYRMTDYYHQVREIRITLLRDDYKLREPYKHSFDSHLTLWIEQFANGHLVRSVSVVVSVKDEHPVYISYRFLPHYFAVFLANEFSGELFLLDNSGTWFLLPGHTFCFDESTKTIYSFVPGECGECRIGKFNLTTKEMTTKMSPHSATAWPEYPRACWNRSIFEEEQRVKWEMKE